MSWDQVFEVVGRSVLSRAELLARGASGRSLASAVQVGALRRLRRDHYVLPSLDADACTAVQVGGRATCVTALRAYGVFAFDTSKVHISIDREASRLRSPRERRRRLDSSNRASVVLHWTTLIDAADGEEHRVGIVDALAHAVVCQAHWHAIASIDNALRLGLIDDDAVSRLFARLPQKYGWMRAKLNPLAEAGQESVLRLLVEEAGFGYELQVTLEGVGRVDIVVEGVLVLEADSRAHHDGWEHHVRDRGRDLIAAQLGYATLRPAYQHTMHNPELVRDAIVGIIAALKR